MQKQLCKKCQGQKNMDTNWVTKLNDTDRVLIFGNEQEHSMTKAYDKKRVVHAGAKGITVDPAHYQEIWTDNIQNQTDNSKLVYVNVPFCQTQCAYCGFFKYYSKSDLMEQFTNAIEKEIQFSADTPYMQSGVIDAIYIGGGTPGALSAKQIDRLLSGLKRNLPLSNDCEFTFESRTFQLTDDKLKACIDNGVNRFSIGVQSFNTEARQSIGRIDTGENVYAMIEKLQGLNHATVSIDLMYGLPYQTPEIFLEDIKIADSLEVDGIALYQLNVFDKSKLDELVKSGKLPKPPETKEQAHYHMQAFDHLSKLNFTQCSMSHWLKGNRDRSIYNQYSKKGLPMHAFGVGAGGKTETHSYFTHVALEPYVRMIDSGIKPIMGMSQQNDQQKLYNMISSSIDAGFLRFDKIEKQFGIDLKIILSPLLESWENRELITLTPQMLKLTPQGQFWYVNMAQAILDVLELVHKGDNYTLTVANVAAQG